MARFTKKQVLETLEANGMMPLFYHADLEICKNVIRACYDGGCRIFEYTNRGEKAYQNFVALISFCEQELPELILGIGTVYDVPTAQKYVAAGSNFIVAPIMNPAVGHYCQQINMLWGPGVMTLTEIYNATLVGAEFVKIFPGDVLQPAFVKAIKGPMPDIKIMATGGVSPTYESLEAWLRSGVMAVGIGSQLTSNAVIASGNYSKITETVAYCLDSINKIKAT